MLCDDLWNPSTRSDDLLQSLRDVEKLKKHVENSVVNLPLMEHQVGVVVCDRLGIIGFEVFDSPRSWAALHKKIIAKYDDVLLTETTHYPSHLFETQYVQKMVLDFIEEISRTTETPSVETSTSKTVVLEDDRLIGEYTMLRGEVIHLIVFRK